MAVAYVSHTISKSTEGRTSPSFEHTVAAGNNRYLMVAVHILDGETVSGVTYDGNAMSLLDDWSPIANSFGIMVYGRLLGTSGSQTVADVVVTSSSGEYNPDAVVAVDFTGVLQSDPVGAIGHAGTTGTCKTTTPTTEADNSLQFGFATAPGEDCAPMYPNTGQTERWDTVTGGGDNDLADFTFWGGGQLAATAGANPFTVCRAEQTSWFLVSAVELKKSSGIEGSATAKGVGTVSASAVLEIPGTATAKGVGTVSATAVQVLSRSATVNGVGTVSAAGTVTTGIAGTATATGVGDAAGTAVLEVPGTATVKGVGTATGAGTVEGVLFGVATATGVGAVSASAVLEIPGAAKGATGKGKVSATAVQVLPRSAIATGVGEATGAGTVTTGLHGTATVKGVGTASGAAVLEIPGAATVKGTGTATGAGTLEGGVFGVATATGVGDAAATPVLEVPGAATASGVGAASGQAVLWLPSAATATGVGTAAGDATLWSTGTATVTGVGTAAGAAIMWLSGLATATGVGSVSAVGTVGGNIAHWGEPCETYTAGPRRGAY